MESTGGKEFCEIRRVGVVTIELLIPQCIAQKICSLARRTRTNNTGRSHLELGGDKAELELRSPPTDPSPDA